MSAIRKRSRRCVCGACSSCTDNDRWERIFQAKYGQQERDYYAGRELRSAGVSAKAFGDASIYACAEEGKTSAVKVSETDNAAVFWDLVRRIPYTAA